MAHSTPQSVDRFHASANWLDIELTLSPDRQSLCNDLCGVSVTDREPLVASGLARCLAKAQSNPRCSTLYAPW